MCVLYTKNSISLSCRSEVPIFLIVILLQAILSTLRLVLNLVICTFVAFSVSSDDDLNKNRRIMKRKEMRNIIISNRSTVVIISETPFILIYYLQYIYLTNLYSSTKYLPWRSLRTM